MGRLWNSTLITAAVLAVSISAHAQYDEAETYELQPSTLLIEGSVEEYQQSLMHDTGYRVALSNLKNEYLVMDNVKAIFKAHAGIRAKMPAALPAAFAPIVKDITDYINKIAKVGNKNNETSNGITNTVLAEKITRLSFCFGTDPYGIAAQLKKESTFMRKSISGTGAVGFTQMTGAAIDEVHDQLGNRGVNGTILENVPYLRSAAACYLGPNRRFVPMFESGVIPKGKNVRSDKNLLVRAKTYLRTHVDSDLIYGQITLKVHLARAKGKGLVGAAAYKDAFKAYNGEPRGRAYKYANEVVTSMKAI